MCATVGLDPGERGAVRIETLEPRQLILRGAADAWSPTAWLKALEARHACGKLGVMPCAYLQYLDGRCW